ncbi:type II toxin-antitoxin system HicA family toxin [Pectobacterium versatile]|uniref:type II toxin-antitoxin system HicA family toxin n=1 Tax=Pectobacterium versatile TaxID=2488639 RepID=UPI000D007B46|nr:type II toxin-antitoxin system HicA family toxin [Pectobacterium versatile]PRI21499.1 hexulose-6-phosphate synthase [Pectobacterium versatile]
MGRREKLRAKLDALPSDFTWDQLVTIMSMYGFNVHNGSGSRRKFFNEEINRVVSFHKPHPGNIVKKYVLEQAKALLEEID